MTWRHEHRTGRESITSDVYEPKREFVSEGKNLMREGLPPTFRRSGEPSLISEEPYGRTELRKGEGVSPGRSGTTPEEEQRPGEVPSTESGETETETRRIEAGEKLQG